MYIYKYTHAMYTHAHIIYTTIQPHFYPISLLISIFIIFINRREKKTNRLQFWSYFLPERSTALILSASYCALIVVDANLMFSFNIGSYFNWMLHFWESFFFFFFMLFLSHSFSFSSKCSKNVIFMYCSLVGGSCVLFSLTI